MLQRKINLWLSFIFLLSSVIVYVAAMGYDAAPAKFPKLLAVSCAVLSILLFVRAVIHPKREDGAPAEESGGRLMTLLVCLGMAGYAMALKFGGFIAPSIVMMIFIGWVLGYRKFGQLLVISTLFVLFVYGVFGLLLGVPLPLPFFME